MNSDVMNHEVVSYPLIGIRDTATVTEAARLMSDAHMGAVGVLDPRFVFEGIFTERDLAALVADHKDPGSLRLVDVVNKTPVVVEGPLTASEARDRMRGANVRHLIVRMSDDDYHIVSMRDLL